MTTFEFEVTRKDQDGAEAIFKVNKFLLTLLAKRMTDQNMTRSKLAEKLEVDKSTISKILRGSQNVTVRTLGEICGALDFDFDLVARDLLPNAGNNGDLRTRKPRLETPTMNAPQTGSTRTMSSYHTPRASKVSA